MRKLVIVLIVLAALLVIVDRVAVSGAEREIARQVQSRYDLAEPPAVEIRGVPFLTQALSGRYDEIAVSMGEITQEGVTLSRIDATLYGVSAPLADLIQNSANARISAERVTGTAVISMETIAARAPRGIKVESGKGGSLKVSGDISVLGRSVPVAADLKIAVARGAVRLTPVNLEVAGGFSVPEPERLITFTVPVRDLPLNLRITGVKTTPDGVAVEGTATDVPLR
jgi:hypothetical protein